MSSLAVKRGNINMWWIFPTRSHWSSSVVLGTLCLEILVLITQFCHLIGWKRTWSHWMPAILVNSLFQILQPDLSSFLCVFFHQHFSWSCSALWRQLGLHLLLNSIWQQLSLWHACKCSNSNEETRWQMHYKKLATAKQANKQRNK